ncbi:hypothetical protein F5B21DRAFT_504669 [Xylaria acuta]|nr:hypothetical protein F5B21DRAFT_504669 [Xylaria acuta]
MNGIHNEHYDRDEDKTDTDTRAYELRLWPPPYLQAYCLDHFLMECKTYHEQENDRYNKLVVYSREVFLDRKNKDKLSDKPILPPTRRQPARQAKEKHSVLDMTPPPTPTPTEPQCPPRPKRPSNTPLKPARLEAAFTKSQEGAMFRVLSQLRRKLELHKSWIYYRQSLEDEVQETAGRLRAKIENGKDTHENCIFSEPLGVECRYCGFVDTVRDDEATTPRKLAAPAAMHAIAKASSDTRGSEVTFRGTSFIVDVCSGKIVVILVSFKGVLDLCAGLFAEEEALPDSPSSLSHRLSNIKLQPEDVGIAGTKRRLEEPKPGKSRKRQKYSTGSRV